MSNDTLLILAAIGAFLSIAAVIARLCVDDEEEIEITDDDYLGDRHPSAMPRDFHGASEDFK
jgi:hypothetical protein